MNSSRNPFRWLATAVITTLVLQFVFLIPSASAQGDEPPTPTIEATSATDLDQDGLPDDSEEEMADTGPSDAQSFGPASRLSAQSGTTISIGMIQTGLYNTPRNRLMALGFSVTLIPAGSDLAVFQQYTIVYLPLAWADGSAGAYQTIESHASDYRAYVNGGGGLFVEQPNPNLQPNGQVTPTLLPYSITFSNVYDPADRPRIVDPDHTITTGLATTEMPFPFDQLIAIDPAYHILVVGNASGLPSLAVAQYGGGNVLIEASNPSYSAISVFSDEVYRRMINWTADTRGTPVLDRAPLILVPGATGTYLNNRNGEVWPNATKMLTSESDDFLLPLRLDATGTGPLFPDNLDYSTVEAGDIISKIAIYDYYGHAIEALEAAGYKQNVDLFIFPYDWRKSVDVLAGDLLAKIDEVRMQTGAERVDIVAHSMGGLVTREVLANPASIGKIRKVFTLGSPVLGAPKILGLLEYQTPCFLYLAFGCRVNASVIQDLLTNMPSTYQILPGPPYQVAQNSPLKIDHDTNGDGQPEGAQSYSDWTAIVRAHRNSFLLQDNQPFHDTYDNLMLADPSVQFYRFVGDKLNTIVQIREYLKCVYGTVGCKVKYALVMDNGDGTVPLHSADLYNPDAGFDYRNGVTDYYRHGVEHGSLPGDDCLLNTILAFIEDSPAGCVSAANTFKLAAPAIFTEGISTSPEAFGGIELETVGPVQGIVKDDKSNVLDPTLDPNANVIPGAVYNAISDTQSFFLNQNGNYVAQLAVTGTEPIVLRVRTYADDAMNGQALFNVSAPINSRFQIAFSSTADLADLQLKIDANADGVFEQTMTPASVLNEMESSDTRPPTIEILSPNAAQPTAGTVKVLWQTRDDLSGVLDQWGVIDSETSHTLTVTNGSFVTLPPGLHTLTVMAEDRAGNGTKQQTAFTSFVFFLHGSGGAVNPATLFIDDKLPTTTTAKYRDSASTKFSGGNAWKDVGTWTASPSLSVAGLSNLNQLRAWLGLINSDDQGTNFDLRVEIYKNNTLVGSAESLCIRDVTRNPSLAKEITLPFSTVLPANFNGTTDVLSLKIKARIGTNGTGAMCGGHSSAVGLRLYFDATNRASTFDGDFAP